MILGGVGLGVCSACRAPGAFWYQSTMPGWTGVWMCDSCQWPGVAAARVRTHVERIRSLTHRTVTMDECQFGCTGDDVVIHNGWSVCTPESRTMLADERRALLAEIREAARNAPVEDVDDSDVIGFGQRENATEARPPRAQQRSP